MASTAAFIAASAELSRVSLTALTLRRAARGVVGHPAEAGLGPSADAARRSVAPRALPQPRGKRPRWRTARRGRARRPNDDQQPGEAAPAPYVVGCSSSIVSMP